MAYMLHLERDEPFCEEEWRAVVDSEPSLALRGANFAVARNPTTGEVIRVEASPLDAIGEELSFQFGDRISFSGGAFELGGEARGLALRLAHRLGARVVGDEGELYSET